MIDSWDACNRFLEYIFLLNSFISKCSLIPLREINQFNELFFKILTPIFNIF